MAKQENYVRTQVRLENDVYHLLKEYSQANDLSMNEAMNRLLFDAMMKELADDNFDEKQQLLEMATAQLPHFSLKEIRDVCAIIHYIGMTKR